jgi:hypothetical protein
MPRSSMPIKLQYTPIRQAPSILNRMLGLLALAALTLVCIAPLKLRAQMPRDFNACLLFTAEDAGSVLGGPAEQELVKGKAPKTSTQCVYLRQNAGRTLTASANFRFFRSSGEALATLKESRLEVRGRPLIINGQDAYWHPKAAHLVVAKGNAVVVLQVGSPTETERDPEVARKAAERLLPRMGG